MNNKVDNIYYNQTPKRKAEFITPPNLLKSKVGSGDISLKRIEKAQQDLENNDKDFAPFANERLAELTAALNQAKENMEQQNHEDLIDAILHPAMQLKANGGMFHYPLITTIADKLVHFLEVIARIDKNVIEIVIAFHQTFKIVITGKIKNDGGEYGQKLTQALEEACVRYFERHSDNNEDIT